MKKLFLIRFSVAAFFCLLCVLPALAANIKIKGAVKDKLSKEPLIGATIRLLGTQAGAVTDMEGNFELNSMGVLEGMYDIEIKYVGYKTEDPNGEMIMNPNSLEVKECFIEPSVKDAKKGDRFQFMRNGYYIVDTKDTTDEHLVFNRIVPLKSSFKLK